MSASECCVHNTYVDVCTHVQAYVAVAVAVAVAVDDDDEQAAWHEQAVRGCSSNIQTTIAITTPSVYIILQFSRAHAHTTETETDRCREREIDR